MGHFLQSLYEIILILCDAVRGILSEITSIPKGIKNSDTSKLFSKENRLKWLYFIPPVIAFIAAMALILL